MGKFIPLLLLSIICCTLGFKIEPNDDIVFDAASIIKDVNSAKTTWTAGENFHPDTKISYLKRLAGAIVTESYGSRAIEDRCDDKYELPEQFDARVKWGHICPSLNHIYDQGNCGSCWAVAVASSFTDRLCIATEGKKKIKLSGQALTSCCHKCAGQDGCSGGRVFEAWDFVRRHGLVTGGSYNSSEGCQPYLLEQCSHHVKGPFPLCSDTERLKSPKCGFKCYNQDYKTPWKQDLHKAKSIAEIGPCSAKREIITNGPIVATFRVYEDFYTYKSGVYQYTRGQKVGYHAVRVMGWGIDNGVEYWLVANSWNKYWGDKGLIKFYRNSDECYIEENFSAGYP